MFKREGIPSSTDDDIPSSPEKLRNLRRRRSTGCTSKPHGSTPHEAPTTEGSNFRMESARYAAAAEDGIEERPQQEPASLKSTDKVAARSEDDVIFIDSDSSDDFQSLPGSPPPADPIRPRHPQRNSANFAQQLPVLAKGKAAVNRNFQSQASRTRPRTETTRRGASDRSVVGEAAKILQNQETETSFSAASSRTTAADTTSATEASSESPPPASDGTGRAGDRSCRCLEVELKLEGLRDTLMQLPNILTAKIDGFKALLQDQTQQMKKLEAKINVLANSTAIERLEALLHQQSASLQEVHERLNTIQRETAEVPPPPHPAATRVPVAQGHPEQCPRRKVPARSSTRKRSRESSGSTANSPEDDGQSQKPLDAKSPPGKRHRSVVAAENKRLETGRPERKQRLKDKRPIASRLRSSSPAGAATTPKGAAEDDGTLTSTRGRDAGVAMATKQPPRSGTPILRARRKSSLSPLVSVRRRVSKATTAADKGTSKARKPLRKAKAKLRAQNVNLSSASANGVKAERPWLSKDKQQICGAEDPAFGRIELGKVTARTMVGQDARQLIRVLGTGHRPLVKTKPMPPALATGFINMLEHLVDDRMEDLGANLRIAYKVRREFPPEELLERLLQKLAESESIRFIDSVSHYAQLTLQEGPMLAYIDSSADWMSVLDNLQAAVKRPGESLGHITYVMLHLKAFFMGYQRATIMRTLDQVNTTTFMPSLLEDTGRRDICLQFISLSMAFINSRGPHHLLGLRHSHDDGTKAYSIEEEAPASSRRLARFLIEFIGALIECLDDVEVLGDHLLFSLSDIRCTDVRLEIVEMIPVRAVQMHLLKGISENFELVESHRSDKTGAPTTCLEGQKVDRRKFTWLMDGRKLHGDPVRRSGPP